MNRVTEKFLLRKMLDIKAKCVLRIKIIFYSLNVICFTCGSISILTQQKNFYLISANKCWKSVQWPG